MLNTDPSINQRLRFERSGRVRTAAVAAALGALLGGCSVGPRYAEPAAGALVPQRFATAAPALSLDEPQDRWWTSLGDATLTGLIESALADNPDLAAAEARVQQARALVRVAGAARYPGLNSDARISRDKLSRNGENLALIPFTPATTEFTDYRLGLDASWELDFFGKTRRQIEAAVARQGGSAESRNDARAVVAAEVADAYVDYREGIARGVLARQSAADLIEALRLTELQRLAGLASESDLDHARADSRSAEAALAPFESQRQGALFRLAALTGAPSASIAERLGESAAIPAAPSEVAVGLPAQVLRRRPDVRRAERDYAAATADVGGAVAAQFPSFSLVGDVGLDSVRTGQLTSAASRYWNLTPQLTVPLLAGGRLRGNVQSAEAARDAALATYRGTVLQAIADAETALVRFAAAQRRAADLSARAASLDAAAALERRRQGAGDISMIDLLAAQRAARDAAGEDAAARAQLVREYAALSKALGGGWQRID